MKFYWHCNSGSSINFGDMLTPIIVKSILGQEAIPASIDESNKILCCGSIISGAKEGDIIYGSGAITEGQILSNKNKYICNMARGKLSRNTIRQMSIECPDYAIDPAVLIPFIYDLFNYETYKQYDIGIFPHGCSYNHFIKNNQYYSNSPVFQVTVCVEDVLKNILQCKTIITESLHVMIVAESLNIPTVFIQTLNQHDYDFTWKFRDYNSTTDRDFINPILWFEEDNIYKKIDKLIYNWIKPKQPDYKQMLELCPFNIRNITNTDQLLKVKL